MANGTAIRVWLHRRLIVGIAVGGCLLFALGLFAIGRGESRSNASAVQPIVIPSTVVVTLGDGGMEPATFDVAAGTPPVSKGQALAIARRYVAGASVARGVQVAYARLTLPDVSGFSDHRPITQRPVWLVQFSGVPFSALPVCACASLSAQPNSDVAIDASTATPVALFGSA